jgi:hypothetical protein
VSVRVKPSRKVRKAIRTHHPRSLALTVRLSLPGGAALERKLTIRRSVS